MKPILQQWELFSKNDMKNDTDKVHTYWSLFFSNCSLWQSIVLALLCKDFDPINFSILLKDLFIDSVCDFVVW